MNSTTEFSSSFGMISRSCSSTSTNTSETTNDTSTRDLNERDTVFSKPCCDLCAVFQGEATISKVLRIYLNQNRYLWSNSLTYNLYNAPEKTCTVLQ